jgi:hypothetical protein
MDFAPLICLALIAKTLTTSERAAFDKEMRRLQRYISGQTRRWPTQLRPNEADLQDLSNSVLEKILDRNRSSGETLVVSSGYMYRVVQSVLSDFLAYQIRGSLVGPMPSSEDAMSGMQWSCPHAELDRFKSNLRIAATRVVEEVRERLDMNSALGCEQFRLLVAVLLAAIEDPFSDERDVYIAAQKAGDRNANASAAHTNRVTQRLKDSPALSKFMRERGVQLAQLARTTSVPRWGRGIRSLASRSSASSNGSMGTMVHTAVDPQHTAGAIDDLLANAADDDTTPNR